MSSKRPRLRLPIDNHDALDAAVTPLTPYTPGTLGTSGTPGTPVESIAGELPNPLASRDMFFALSLYSPPEWESELSETGEPSPGSDPELEHLVDSPPGPLPPTEYDDAIARVNRLDGFLTPGMKSTLTCLLTVIQLHLSPPTLNGVPAITDQLITRVASQDETPDHGIKDIVDIIEKGLLVFSALGGGSTGSVAGSTSLEENDGPRKRQRFDADGNVIKTTRRSAKVRRDCKARDPTCQICRSLGGGEVAHIIPYSAKDEKGIDFWKFVELFRGVQATAALKAVALAPNPESIDTMKNVWYLCKTCHDAFGRAKLSVIPDLAELTYPYDPTQTISYPATIEFPRGNRAITIACWKKGPRGRMVFDKELEAGHVITLSTDDAVGLPLPHPLLFQIHAIISRLIAMKAAAGFPLFPEFNRDDYNERAIPTFTDNVYVDWLDQHPEHADPESLPGRYDSGSTEPHIMRWFKLIPDYPIKDGFPSSSASGSNSDADAQHQLKGDQAEDSDTDTDEERPREYAVVLSEVGQRMDEKRELAIRRMTNPEYLYWCT